MHLTVPVLGDSTHSDVEYVTTLVDRIWHITAISSLGTILIDFHDHLGREWHVIHKIAVPATSQDFGDVFRVQCLLALCSLGPRLDCRVRTTGATGPHSTHVPLVCISRRIGHPERGLNDACITW